jgi:flagellar hook protein FlgE
VFSDQVLISNWTPLDPDGNPNGAMGPQNVLAGGSVNIPDPPTSSNFVVDLEGTTQFGSVFSVNDVDQNGYTTGRLSGLNIDDSGIIFARFTNGESQILGQVILADFANNQGLQPVGDSMWAENFESGPPNIGTPGSAALGAIQAGALEESNVDLSEELVRLIIAQRNFQANAKTIETANQVTQTVINLR